MDQSDVDQREQQLGGPVQCSWAHGVCLLAGLVERGSRLLYEVKVDLIHGHVHDCELQFESSTPVTSQAIVKLVIGDLVPSKDTLKGAENNPLAKSCATKQTN